MKCKDCKFWQGHRLSEWADCYRVVAKIEPNLLGCMQEEEEYPGTEFYFTVPFDPHHIKYWRHHEFWPKLYNKALNSTPEGVRTEYVRELDTAYTKEGIESSRTVGLTYFQTHKEYTCHDE